MSQPIPNYGGGYPAPQRNNGMAIASLIVGILSIPACFGYGLGLVMGIVAIVLGVLARKKVKLGQAGQGGLALGGIITGIVGVVLGAIFLAMVVFAFGMFGSAISDCATISDPIQQQQCIEDNVSSSFS